MRDQILELMPIFAGVFSFSSYRGVSALGARLSSFCHPSATPDQRGGRKTCLGSISRRRQWPRSKQFPDAWIIGTPMSRTVGDRHALRRRSPRGRGMRRIVNEALLCLWSELFRCRPGSYSTTAPQDLELGLVRLEAEASATNVSRCSRHILNFARPSAFRRRTRAHPVDGTADTHQSTIRIFLRLFSRRRKPDQARPSHPFAQRLARTPDLARDRRNRRHGDGCSAACSRRPRIRQCQRALRDGHACGVHEHIADNAAITGAECPAHTDVPRLLGDA